MGRGPTVCTRTLLSGATSLPPHPLVEALTRVLHVESHVDSWVVLDAHQREAVVQVLAVQLLNPFHELLRGR